MEGETFSSVHIAVTAAITGGLVLGAGWWQLRGGEIVTILLVALISGLAVFLWRQSANMPQLNSDGLEGFSADDWLAPVVVYVALSCFAALRPGPPSNGLAKTCALAAVIALIVNVVTI